MDQQQRQEKLQQARTDYGRPFPHEITVARRTPPSPLLIELNRRSAEKAAVLQ